MRDAAAKAAQPGGTAGVATAGEGLCVCSRERVRVLGGSLVLTLLG
jgi:hypothetical protein